MNITTEDTIILTRRENAVMAPLNESQILILGGDGESGYKSDAYILNTLTSSIHQVSPDLGLKVCTWSNQCLKTSPDLITALVQDENWTPFVINYSIRE